MDWTQVYDPLGAPVASTLVAALPILVLLGLLARGVSAPMSALAGLMTALASAVFVFGMPVRAALASAAYGAAFGILPIGWIVVAAVFLFRLTVETGQFEIVKRSVAAISPDRRIQAILIAFSFGAFLEGAAGFGTPVAISAALLIGLGFTPLHAAGLALIANTSPVAFGALGTPIWTLEKISNIDALSLSQMAGRQLPLFSLIVPAWLVATMAGWRGVVGCWPAILVGGGTFASLQFMIANWHGPALVDVAGGVGSLVLLTLFLRFWQPATIWRFSEEPPHEPGTELTGRSVLIAWLPWALLSMMVFLWGVPSIKNWLERPFGTSMQGKVAVPELDGRIYRAAPVAPADSTGRALQPEKAEYTAGFLSATGTAIFLAAAASAVVMGVSPAAFCWHLLRTIAAMRWALATIAAMLALAFVTKYSGSDATLGLAFTRTGWLYPFFAPLLGWLGVALTGSDTSSNALFGSLQRITAEQLGLPPTLIVASNSTGGVMGKMIDAQSIVVAAVATGRPGEEGRILRFVFPHSLALAALVGLWTLLQAYAWPWMIP